MDFLNKTLFNNINYNLTSKFKGTSKSIINQDDPIKIIEEQVKILEDVNLSPMPETALDLQIQKNEVMISLKKIVFAYHTILNDGIKQINQRKLSIVVNNNSNNGINNTVSNNINNNSKYDEEGYWSYISKYFRINSVKFINNVYEKLKNNTEKGIVWLTISILENSFYDSLNEIFSQEFDK